MDRTRLNGLKWAKMDQARPNTKLDRKTKKEKKEKKQYMLRFK